MVKIKNTTGYFEYKSIPIFSGCKKIDKGQSAENLLLLKKILDKHDIMFQLTAGTLLGAVREKDFIDHDEDIDLALFDEDKLRVFDILPKLVNVVFLVARYDGQGVLSILRKGEYIDLCFFKIKNDIVRSCSGCLILRRFLENSTTLEFKGTEFFVPQDYIEFLICEYGDNWQTPIEFFNFERSKFDMFKKKLFYTVKEMLPDWLYFILKPHFVKKVESEYKIIINKYLNKKGEKLIE